MPIRYILALTLLYEIAFCIILFPPQISSENAVKPADIPQVVELPMPGGQNLEADIESTILRIRSGVLPPIEEDATLDASEDLLQQDVHLVFNHAESALYMKRIDEHLGRGAMARNDPHHHRIRLYDDRFIPVKNQVVLQHKYPFSLPGGTVFFGARLFLKSESEAEIAGVLAHEAAHGILRHTATSRLYQKNIARLQERAEKNSSSYDLMVLAFATAFVFADFDRSIEKEADMLAQVILREAGYDDLAFTTVLKENLSPTEKSRIKRAEEDSFVNRSKGAPRRKFIIASPEKFSALQLSLKYYLEKYEK
ncbi:MAG: M48 family metalloprotease [bacterium]|nr:M48 family metalloprotease [bacterium]